MEIEQFSHSLCGLNNTIDKYLIAQRSMEFIKVNRLAIHIPDEDLQFIEDLIWEKLKASEKQIIELALKLTQEKAE